MKILDERWKELADRERALLEGVAEFLTGFGAPAEDAELARRKPAGAGGRFLLVTGGGVPAEGAGLVRRKLADVEELFLLVIVGEFNSGKSAFINALLGAVVSTEGVTPITDRITVLRYAEEPVERERREGAGD